MKFSQIGCEYISHSEYRGENTFITFKCSCGEYETKRSSSISKNPHCQDCISKIRENIIVFDFEQVKKFIEEESKCKLIRTADIDSNSLLLIKCGCGIEYRTTFHKFKYENRRQCKKCYKKSPSRGENHHSWQGDIYQEDRKFRKSAEYREWRLLVLQRDNYTCQCCNTKSKKLNTHHIKSYSEYEDSRVVVSNGITLCAYCHHVGYVNSFHSIYGIKDNNKEQLQEYFNNKRKRLGLHPILIEDITG